MWSNWAKFGCLFFLPRANLHGDPWTHPEPSDDRRTHGTCLQSDQHHSFTTRGPTGCLLGAHHTSWCVNCLSVCLSVFQRPPMTTDYFLPICFSNCPNTCRHRRWSADLATHRLPGWRRQLVAGAGVFRQAEERLVVYQESPAQHVYPAIPPHTGRKHSKHSCLQYRSRSRQIIGS